jgi:GAF domain-containing protein
VQQTATSEVLKVISSSGGELLPVFEALLENATRLCAAKFGTLYLSEGDAFRTTVMHNVPPAFAEARLRNPLFRPPPGSALRRMAESKRAVHIPDVTLDQGYLERQPLFVTAVELGGFLAMLSVPMLKDGNLVGAINIYRQEVGPFSDKQIDLVQNFAAQAVIAIENTRLLSELRQRTDDLSEALEQQTATSEVLKVISGSPSELKPVFDAILENATRICEAKFGTMWLREGDAFRVVALHNAPPAYEERRRNRLIPLVDLHPKSAFGRFLKTRQVTHIADVRLDQGYLDGAPTTIDVADAAGARTVLMVPMLKDNELVGSITIYRQEVRLFADTQIELVKNFANQAVIAIENTRLLSELRESLQQQTATADVLKVISRSTFDLQPVLNTLTESAARLCEAYDSSIFLRQGESLHHRAHHGPIPQDLADLPRTRVRQRSRLRRSCTGPRSRSSGIRPRVPGWQQSGASSWPPDSSGRPSAEGRRGHRHTPDPSYRGEAIHRQADRVS